MFKPVLVVSMALLVASVGYSSFSTSSRISKLQTTLSAKKTEYQKDLDTFNKLNKDKSKASDVKTVLINAKSAGEKVVGIENKLNATNDDSLISSLSDLMDEPKKFIILPVKNAEWKFITNYSVSNGKSLPVCFIYKATDDDILYAYALATYDGTKFSDVSVKVTKTYTDKVYGDGTGATKSAEDIKKMVDDANNTTASSEEGESSSSEEVTSTTAYTEDDGNDVDDYMSEYERSSLANEHNGGSN